jgi:pimeloyl-ACP methyl ester carboxylesterase
MTKLFSLLLSLFLITTLFSSSVFASSEKSDYEQGKNFSAKVDAGGFNLYLNVQGKNKGEPTVVFESGYGDDSTVWANVQSEISKYTRTVSYDRAGLGKSDLSPNPRTSANQVQELHTALVNAKIKKPYIIVAHSIGGYNARLFATTYKSEVAGIVFVDSSHEDQNAAILNALPPEIKDLYLGQFTAEGDYNTILTSAEEVRLSRQADALRNIPITVISATEHGLGNELETLWAGFQKDIASLSNNSAHVIAQGSTHYVYLDQPQLVIDNIVSMLQHRINHENDDQSENN